MGVSEDSSDVALPCCVGIRLRTWRSRFLSASGWPSVAIRCKGGIRGASAEEALVPRNAKAPALRRLGAQTGAPPGALGSVTKSENLDFPCAFAIWSPMPWASCTRPVARHFSTRQLSAEPKPFLLGIPPGSARSA